MTRTDTVRDGATRGLSLAVRLLPPARREWGDAMRAELAVVENGRARRRYALGCTRAVLADQAARRSLLSTAGLLAFAITALVLAFGIRSSVIQIEMITCIVLLCLCCALARRSGFLGPVGDSRTAQRIRVAGCGVVMTCLLIFDKPPYPKDTGWWLAGVILVLYLVGVLSATARIAQPELRVVAFFSLAGAFGWWIPMLAFSVVRAAPHASLVLVGSVVLGCCMSVGGTTRSAAKGLIAGAGAGAATCLLIFVAAIGIYAVLPNLVPDIAGTTCCAGGLTPADRAETNRIESTDPYIAELVLGAALSVLLIGGLAVTRPPKPAAVTTAIDTSEPAI